MKILMVCLGNICRSPLAEGILASKIDLSEHTVDSAGTGGWHQGELPDRRSIDIAAKNGLDITYQRARKFLLSDFENFDIIFAMDESNYSDLIYLARNDMNREKVRLILDEVHAVNRNVPDPYYGGKDGFVKVYEMLDKATDTIIDLYKL